VSQLVFVLVDVSYSMEENFEAGMSRIEAVSRLLTTFENCAYQKRTMSLIGLMTFASDSQVLVGLTPLTGRFSEMVWAHKLSPNTRMFGAMQNAAQSLVMEKEKYPNAVLRIVLLSDGEDNRTSPDAVRELPTYLIRNQVRVDSIVVSNEIDKRLHRITKMTGGVLMNPNNLEAGRRIFEHDAFFDVGLRRFGGFELLPIPPNWMDTCQEVRDVDIVSPRKMDESRGRKLPLADPRQIAIQYNGRQDVAPRQLVILKQLRVLLANPIEGLMVYVCKDQVDPWYVLMRVALDPGGYGGVWWYLRVKFLEAYPRVPPQVVFAHPPYHPNISDDGKICIKTLVQGSSGRYVEKSTMHGIFTSIIELLRNPNFDEPFDPALKDLHDKTPDEYARKVRESVERNARRDYIEWMEGMSPEGSIWDIVRGDPNAELDLRDAQFE
jgi:ubiquitin-protein ligase